MTRKDELKALRINAMAVNAIMLDMARNPVSPESEAEFERQIPGEQGLWLAVVSQAVADLADEQYRDLLPRNHDLNICGDVKLNARGTPIYNRRLKGPVRIPFHEARQFFNSNQHEWMLRFNGILPESITGFLMVAGLLPWNDQQFNSLGLTVSREEIARTIQDRIERGFAGGATNPKADAGADRYREESYLEAVA